MIHAVQVALILALAPLVQGVMMAIHARMVGRPGPSPLQPYRNLRKLWNKEALVARGTSPLFLAVPGVALGASVTLSALVPPLGAQPRVADAIAIALTLALWRFMLVLGALETRSSFEGLAASREMTFGSLTEAPLILALASLAFGGGTILADVLAGAALLIVALSETARIPVDNQETHYELTMIHEGLVLEYSGWHLAMLQYASWVRQASLLLLAAIVLPGGAIAAAIWMLAFIVAIPLLERLVAKMRLFEVPALFAAATVLALTSIAMHLVRVIS